MKKKKKKKKIKKLEKRVSYLGAKLRGTIDALNSTESHVVQCKNEISKLKDSKGCKDDIKKLSNRIDDILLSTNCLIMDVKRIDTRCDVLDIRTQTDYNKIAQNEEKTCDTCKWKPLMEQGGQDIPCMGCTADDKKMWKSKEA